MQVHKISLYIVDFDAVGADGVRDVIENARYPNRCISPSALSVETAEIGEWHDGHPLNSSVTDKAEIERLFSDPADFPLGPACDLSGEGTCESCS